MRIIYKYELPYDGQILVIDEPVEKILSIQSQNGVPMVWAIINTEMQKEPTALIAIGTGWELPSGLKEYVGTAQDEYGYVWHYFLLENKKIINTDSFAVLAEAAAKAGISVKELSEAIKHLG